MRGVELVLSKGLLNMVFWPMFITIIIVLFIIVVTVVITKKEINRRK